MKINKVTLAVFLILIALLPACGKKSFKIKNVQPLTAQSADFTQTKEQITVQAKKFTQDDAVEAFGKNAPRLFNEEIQYQPIQLSIFNNGTQPYILKATSTNIKIADPFTVFKLLRYSKVGTIAGYTVLTVTCAVIGAALIFTPYFLEAVGGALSALGGGYAGPRTPFLIAALPFFIPGFFVSGIALASPYLGIRAASKKGEINTQIKRNMRAPLLENIQIYPGQTVDFLIFVETKKEIDKFSLILEPNNSVAAPLSFDVNFNKPAEFIKN